MAGMKATRRGSCADCHEPIEKGDQVVYVNDDLVHVACEGSALADLMNMKEAGQ